jgi:hypothetical protein
MIPAFIVITSLVLTVGFGLAWLAMPRLRRKIEDPKYAFHDQLQAYNRQVRDTRDCADEFD